MLFTNSLPAQISLLTIEITDLQNNDGVLQIGFSDNEMNYPLPKKEIITKRIQPANNKAVLQLENLKEGEYALAVYHDENADGQCNRNFFGLPVEGYCFSNNMRPFLSAPPFNKCKFYLDKKKRISIKMIY